jgi:CBS domain-containing protein
MTVVAAPVRRLMAADVMSAPTLSIPPTSSVWTAWSMMMHAGLRHLVVATGEGCLGVIDDRTLFAQWPMGPLALRRHSVRELTRPSTTCVLPDTDLQVVARVMVDEGVDAVPVVDSHDQLVGIVTGSDVARAVALAGICLEEE